MTQENNEFWELVLPFECEDLVRVGSRFDGGYVHSLSTVEDSKVLLSFGIDTNWDFEKDFQKLSKCDVIHAYDYSVSKAKFFNALAHETQKKIRGYFKIGRKKKRNVTQRLESFASFCNAFSHPNVFYQEKISSCSSETEVTVADCMARIHTHVEKIFLKCDIEGSEYEIIEELIDFSPKISGMVIEFHEVRQFPERFMEAVDKLSQKFYCIHSHINNYGAIDPVSGMPDLLEMSFNNISYKREGLAKSKQTYPIRGLDFPNNPSVQDFPLASRENRTLCDLPETL